MDGWWTGKQNEGTKKPSKTIDIVSFASKVSVNGVTFQVIRHILNLLTGLTVNIHVSTKACVTGNNMVLNKALLMLYGLEASTEGNMVVD